MHSQWRCPNKEPKPQYIVPKTWKFSNQNISNMWEWIGESVMPKTNKKMPIRKHRNEILGDDFTSCHEQRVVGRKQPMTGRKVLIEIRLALHCRNQMAPNIFKLRLIPNPYSNCGSTIVIPYNPMLCKYNQPKSISQGPFSSGSMKIKSCPIQRSLQESSGTSCSKSLVHSPLPLHLRKRTWFTTTKKTYPPEKQHSQAGNHQFY